MVASDDLVKLVSFLHRNTAGKGSHSGLVHLLHGFQYASDKYFIHKAMYVLNGGDTFAVAELVGLLIQAGFEFERKPVVVAKDGDFQYWVVNGAYDAHVSFFYFGF